MAGSLIKIDEFTVSSAVSNVILGGGSSGSSGLNASINSTYDVYQVVYNNAKVSTDGTTKISMRFTESGTPNTTANYDRASKFLRTVVSFSNLSNTNQTSFNTESSIGNATGEHQNKTFYIFNANNSSEYTFMTEEATQGMEFIIGFLLGYFLKEISSYLKRISKYDLDSNIDKEWDFLSRDDLP